jgi:hypothetical protein
MKGHYIVLALVTTLVVSTFAIVCTRNVSAGVESSSTWPWTMDDGIRLEGGWPGNPCILELSDGTYRMYYSDSILEYYPLGGVTKSAVSADGLTWAREDGFRLAYGVGGEEGYAGSPEVVVLLDGTYRMYYCHEYYDAAKDDYRSQFLSAVSVDGLEWTKEPGIRIDCGGTYDRTRVEHIDLVKLPDETFRMYYSGLDGTHYRILSAVSADGLTWTKEEGVRIDVGGVYDSLHALSSVTTSLPEGGYVMHYLGHSEEWTGHLLSAVSTDGLLWTKQEGIRIENGEYTLIAPSAMIRLPDNTYRMYITADRFPIWTDRMRIISAQAPRLTIDLSPPEISIASPEAKSYPQDETLDIGFSATDDNSGIASVRGLITPDPATIYIDPQITAAQLGETFSINISIANAVDVGTWQVGLKWNPGIIDFVSVAQGDFLNSHGSTIWAQEIHQSEGYIYCAAAMAPPPIGVNGGGVLATVTFEAIAEGDSTLEFTNPGYDTFLMNPEGMDLPFGVLNGGVSVILGSPAHDVAVIDVTASPLKIASSEPVTITVVVENQGNRIETFDVTTFYDSNMISTQTQTLAPYASATLTFTWDTTGVGIGSYLIKAEASLVPGEVDTVDNTYVDGPVAVGMGVHNGQTIELSTLPTGKYTLTVRAFDNAGNKAEAAVVFKVMPVIHLQFDIEPDCLNLMSNGQYVTGYLELPNGYDVANINVSSILLNCTVPVDQSAPHAIGDHDKDSIPDLMVKFNRTTLVQYIVSQHIQFGNVALALTGQLKDGTFLKGSVAIKVSGLMGDVNCDGKVDIRDVALAIYAFCSHPGDKRWNDNANFAQPWDVINILDLAKIILNCGKHYP